MELFQQVRPLWGSEGHRHRGGLWLLGPVPQGADQDVDILEFLALHQVRQCYRAAVPDRGDQQQDQQRHPDTLLVLHRNTSSKYYLYFL